jgi:hypothetical protein
VDEVSFRYALYAMRSASLNIACGTQCLTDAASCGEFVDLTLMCNTYESFTERLIG